MRVQNVQPRAVNDKLEVTWDTIETADTPRAVIVSFSRDPEFARVTARHLVLPAGTKAMTLDTGAGRWYLRVGVLVGSEEAGTVDWSGVYGPVAVSSTKAAVGEFPPRLRVTGKEATLDGARLITGTRDPYYAFLEVSTSPEFRVGDTRMLYMRDPGRGVLELDAFAEGATYSVHVRSLEGPMAELPAGGRIAPLSAPVEVAGLQKVKPVVRALGTHLRGTVDMNTRQPTGADVAQAEAHRVLLREARNNPVQRFSSYADYMRMVQAQTLNRVAKL
jgi:hypothetical protein